MEAEPLWDLTKNKDQLAYLINWYSYYKDSTDAKKYILDYYQNNSDLIKLYESLPANNIRKGVGWIARIISKVPESKKDLLDYLESDIIRCKSIIIQNKSSKIPVIEKPLLSVQDRINIQVSEMKAEIDGLLDDYLDSKQILTFSIKDILEKFKANHVHASKIIEYYRNNLLRELQEAYSNKDSQLSEAYSFLSRTELKSYINCINKILEELEAYINLSKEISRVNRKPRRKKTKSPVEQVTNLQYLKEWETYKSCYATDLVGASQVWIYNIKTRFLGLYKCDNPHGFYVKGSSLKNFELDSVSKKLRKPQEVLPKILSEGKVGVRKLFENLTTKEKALNGRFNNDTLILKIIK